MYLSEWGEEEEELYRIEGIDHDRDCPTNIYKRKKIKIIIKTKIFVLQFKSLKQSFV